VSSLGHLGQGTMDSGSTEIALGVVFFISQVAIDTMENGRAER